MVIGDDFTAQQMEQIRKEFEDGLTYFNSSKQEEWLTDLLEKYGKFGENTRSSPATKDFLTRVLSGHYKITDW